MTTQTEALTLALELLAVGTFHSPELQAKRTEVIKQGLKALAQPEQEHIQHCEAGPEYCWKCNEEMKPTYGSEEIRKLREVNKSLSDHIVDVNKKVEPPPWWPAIENILNEYGLQAIDFVADFKDALAQQSNEQVEPCEYCKRGLKTMCLCGINAKAIHQFRSPHCADWYDGIPDHHDGHGPYEVRTLYTHPPVPTAQPDCTRSHPHEEMGKECELRTEIARLQNKLAQPEQFRPLTDEHPLMVFAMECALGAYQEHELADAANKAIEAAHGIKG